MEEKYYLYRHVRLDSNIPFYIGIGKKQKKFSATIENEYKRAFSKKRTSYWNKIVNKSKYRVDIVLESCDLNFIKKKEFEFISLYGRRDLGSGSLCNLTDGGEGCFNRISTPERNRKISEALKLRVRKKETFEKTSKALRKKIVGVCGDKRVEYSSITSASIDLGVSLSAISVSLSSDKRKAAGYKWYFNY